MRGTKLLVSGLVAIAVAGCAARGPGTCPGVKTCDMRPGAASPEDVDRLFSERLDAGDVDGVVALYEPGATLVRTDRTAAVGLTAIRAEIATIVALKPRIRMGVKQTLRGGDSTAALYNDWSLTGRGADGQPIELSGKAIEIVHRQPDGTWKYVIDDPDGRSAP